MELLDLLIVAKRVRPPSRNEVDAPIHVLQQPFTSIRCSGQFLCLIFWGLFLHRIVFGTLVVLRYCAEVTTAVEDHLFVAFRNSRMFKAPLSSISAMRSPSNVGKLRLCISSSIWHRM